MTRPLVFLAATALVIGFAPAYAQSPGEGVQSQQQSERPGDRMGAREEERLREVLRDAGFRRIRVLDAAYVVQARTPDGRNVIMYLDPPPRTLSRTGGETARDSGATGSTPQQQTGSVPSQQQTGSPQQQTGGNSSQELNVRESGREQLPTADSVYRLDPLTPQAARSILRARGMTDIQDLRREGDEYRATADLRGEEVEVTVHARTGVVQIASI